MRSEVKIENNAKLSQEELKKYYGMNCSFDFGSAFINNLFYGTLKTIAERVDSNGFCQTSYGEDGNIKCYGHSHYPRDTAEAAWVLASCDMPELAVRILNFSLSNIPKGQYYIPHVYLRDGSIKANTVQVDTPGHIARALERCIEVLGVNSELKKLFDKLNSIINATWEKHFHKEYNLLDGGNFNEQGFGGSSEPILDMFTNCAMFRGCLAMSSMADKFDLPRGSNVYQERAKTLDCGIEANLYDAEKQIYRIAYELKSKSWNLSENWLMLYCQRWYPGRKECWDNAYKLLKQKTSIDCGQYKVITAEPPHLRFRLMGKIFGHYLGFMAQNGLQEDLQHHWQFAINTIRHPENVFPEWWFLYSPEAPGEYMEGFLRHFQGVWTPYPTGDYTVDSGNCEQCAVFLNHMVLDILGFFCKDKQLTIRPVLPEGINHFAVNDLSCFELDGAWIKGGYSLCRNKQGLQLDLKFTQKIPVVIELLVPMDGDISVFVDGHKYKFELFAIGENHKLIINLDISANRVIKVKF